MKKVLLSGLVCLAAISSYAQFASLPDGYHPERGYAKDYFSSPIALDNVYFWTQLTGPKKVAYDSTSQEMFDNLDKGCFKDSLLFTYNWTRSAAGLSYMMTQQYMSYEPVGVGFGVTHLPNGDSVKNVLDLSGGKAFFHFRLENTTDSTYIYTVKAALQDSTGAIINSIGTTAVIGDQYKDEVSLTVAPGHFVDTLIDFNYNAARTKYTYDSCYRGKNAGKDYSFNYHIVSAASVTVVNADNSGGIDGYKPFTMHNTKFVLSKIFIGDITGSPVGIADNFLAKPTFKIYPNPVSNVNGVLNFEKEIKGVQVVNSVGQVVFTAPSASSLDVNNYQKGIYVISSTTGNARFIVQ